MQKIYLEFCKHDGVNICLLCQSNNCYREYQYQIYQYCLNFDFLSKVKDNLYHNLFKMVPTFNNFLCETINRKYQYTFKSSFTGEELKYDLDTCLIQYEEQNIKSIMDKTFKVVI